MNTEPRADSCDREDLRISLGALALDALDAAEAREVRRHLADCSECQAEYSTFLGVRTVLDAGLVGGVARAARHPAHVPARRPAGRASRRPRRGVLVAVGGAAASVGLAVAAFFAGSAVSGPTVATVSPAPVSPSPAMTTLPTVTGSQGVAASISFREAAWGTTLSVTMSNVPDGYVCRLTAYGKDGTETPVSSWTSVPGKPTVTVPGAVALKPAQIDHFEVELNTKGYDIDIPMKL